MSINITQASYGCALGFSYSAGTAYRPTSHSFQDVSGQTQTLEIGATVGKVNKPFATRLTLDSASPTLLDLTALTDDSGAAVSFGTIELLKITLLSTTPGEDLTIGGGTNAVFGAMPEPLRATSRGDSPFFWGSPITVDATHKILQLDAAAGDEVTVLITIVGR